MLRAAVIAFFLGMLVNIFASAIGIHLPLVFYLVLGGAIGAIMSKE